MLDGVSTENSLDSIQGEKDGKIQTVSCEVEEEQSPEYEVSRRAKRDSSGAGFTSAQRYSAYISITVRRVQKKKLLQVSQAIWK